MTHTVLFIEKIAKAGYAERGAAGVILNDIQWHWASNRKASQLGLGNGECEFVQLRLRHQGVGTASLGWCSLDCVSDEESVVSWSTTRIMPWIVSASWNVGGGTEYNHNPRRLVSSCTTSVQHKNIEQSVQVSLFLCRRIPGTVDLPTAFETEYSLTLCLYFPRINGCQYVGTEISRSFCIFYS